MTTISIAIPCFNEAPTIGKVISDFRRAIPEASIIVYDNCSTDDTASIANNAGARVRHVSTKGKGRVIRQALRECDSDILVLVDGDDTYPASEVHKLIAAIKNGDADMAVGDRLSSTYFMENKRPFHNSGNTLICRMVNWIFSSNLHDVLSGYRAFNRRFIQNVVLISNGFEIETEITATALNMEFTIAEIPISYRNRPAGSVSKLSTFSDGWRIIRSLATLFRDYRPMAFFSLVAALLAIVAIIFLTPVFIDYFRTGLVARFPTLIFGCFIMLSGLLSLSVGIILQVIANQNRRMSR